MVFSTLVKTKSSNPKKSPTPSRVHLGANFWVNFWIVLVCVWAVLLQPLSFSQHIKMTWEMSGASSMAAMPLECPMQNQNPSSVHSKTPSEMDSSMDMSGMDMSGMDMSGMDMSGMDSSSNHASSNHASSNHIDPSSSNHSNHPKNSNCCDCCSQNTAALPPLPSSGFLSTRAGFVLHTRVPKVVHLVSLFHNLEARGPPDYSS
jgi:hypothetical protein